MLKKAEKIDKALIDDIKNRIVEAADPKKIYEKE